ncbi:MAG: dynamin family protein [Planctomycetota bacterium]|nr:dynamin family protein [Planctomycetota bacterium]
MALGQDSARLQAAVRSAKRALTAIEGLGKDYAESAKELAEAISAASQERVLVAIVGSAKRGKSTLVNGLLGRRDDTLAPVGRFPATNVVSVFGAGDALKARVFFQSGAPRQISEHEIRDYACEDRNPSNQKQVERIEVEGPFPGIDRRTLLIDLPGTDNAMAEQHSQTLYAFLPRADAIIFMTTADEPINAAEQGLLRHIHGLGIAGIFFAVNKKDYVRLGELDEAELADGIAHNRKIIEDAGFSSPKIHVISAKDYLEAKPDSGVETLARSVQQLVEEQRITLIADRLEARLRIVLEAVRARCTDEYALARTTTEELESKRTELTKSRRDLERGRPRREADFLREWNAALEDLGRSVKRVERELGDSYAQVIQKKSSADLTSLHQTIHSDVHLALLERLGPEMDKCNTRLDAAQKQLFDSVDFRAFRRSEFEAPKPSKGIAHPLVGSAKIGMSALPALATGAAVLATPGLVGSLIATAAPTVVATWSPFTWLPALVASAGATAVTAAQSAAVVALGTIAAPLSLAALGYAGYRSYRTWKNIRSQERNELQISVKKMIEQACEQVIDDPENGVSAKQRKGPEMLRLFNELVEQQIDSADQGLEDLIKNRPSERRVLELEQRTTVIEGVFRQIEPATAAVRDDRGDGASMLAGMR